MQFIFKINVMPARSLQVDTSYTSRSQEGTESGVQLKRCGHFNYGTSELALAIDAHAVAVNDAVVVLSFRRLPRVHLTDLRKGRKRGGREEEEEEEEEGLGERETH
jgi:hypothetical protein